MLHSMILGLKKVKDDVVISYSDILVSKKVWKIFENVKKTEPVGRLRLPQSLRSSLGQGNLIGGGSENRFADAEFGEGILNVPM